MQLLPESPLIAAAASGGVLGITAPQGCPWDVSSNAGFLHITTSPSGGGSDTIGYVVDPNTGAASRTSVVSVGGRSSTITQLGTAPLLTATPAPISLNLIAGSSTPSNSPLSLFTNVASLPYTVAVSMDQAPALNWLTVSTTSGNAPAGIYVSVDPSRLPPGTFTGNITIKSPTASPNQIVVPVTAVLKSGGTSAISVSADPITFALAVGGPSSVVQRAVSNGGAGFLVYSASVENPNSTKWLSVTPSGGSVNVTNTDTLTILASPGSLAAGTYSSAILVSSGGSVTRIPVTMTVGTPGANILLSQVGLTFTGVAGGGSPSPQVFGVLNSGVGSLSWSAKATTLTGGNWLTLDTTSGTVNRPLLDVSLITASVDTSRLNAGDYYAKIEVSGQALNTPQLVTVLVTVLPAGSDPGPEVRPTGLIFVSAPGQKTASQSVGVTNIIKDPVSFITSPATFDGAKWLSQSPLSATVRPNTPGRVDVQSDNSKITPGVLRGVLTLLFQDGRSTTVNVLNIVSPSATATGNGAGSFDNLAPRASTCQQTLNLQVQPLSLRAGFQVPLGQAVPVSVKVADDCTNALVPAGTGEASGATASFSNGDPDLKLSHEGNGQWSGTWTPSKMPSSGSSVTVTVRAFYVKLGSSPFQQTGKADVLGSLRSSASPAPTSASVVNMASLAELAPAGAGSLISIYGSNLASQSGSASSPPLPTSIGGTQVQLGGVNLPLLYSSSGQINAQIPYDIPPNTQQQLVVSSGGTLSVPVLYSVAAAQPGIYTQNLLGTGQGVIMDSSQLRYAEPGTPAARGETVAIYCTGLGAVTPNVQPGAPAPYPFATAANPVSVSIGGIDAQVQSAVLTPGYAGVYQVSAVVPAGAPVGDAVSVTVTVAGQTSNVVTMAVK